MCVCVCVCVLRPSSLPMFSPCCLPQDVWRVWKLWCPPSTSAERTACAWTFVRLVKAVLFLLPDRPPLAQPVHKYHSVIFWLLTPLRLSLWPIKPGMSLKAHHHQQICPVKRPSWAQTCSPATWPRPLVSPGDALAGPTTHPWACDLLVSRRTGLVCSFLNLWWKQP